MMLTRIGNDVDMSEQIIIPLSSRTMVVKSSNLWVQCPNASGSENKSRCHVQNDAMQLFAIVYDAAISHASYRNPSDLQHLR
jgi:hypothetical protein